MTPTYHRKTDGQQVSDMVWVGDVARTLVAALAAANAWDPFDNVIECGPPQSATVLEIAELVSQLAAEHTGREVPIKHLQMRPGEQPGAVVKADSDTLLQVGIEPASLKDLASGMRSTVDWFAENRGATWAPPAPTFAPPTVHGQASPDAVAAKGGI